ncbi:MAG: hypothetical protein KAQ64_02700 [Candidatus Pacebacteria bacterium]|nr:hypothetical protein [Candidatus Paceibacterota bacterium]
MVEADEVEEKEIKSIYEKESHKRLVLELLYGKYQKTKEYFSISGLARELKIDISPISKIINDLREKEIIDSRSAGGKESKGRRGGSIKTLYRLNEKAYNIIRNIKTAHK